MTMVVLNSIPVKVVGSSVAQVAVNDRIARKEHFVVCVYARGIFRVAREVIFNTTSADIKVMSVNSARII